MTAGTAPLLNIYLLAGVKTQVASFAECCRKLDALFREEGREPRIFVLMPYGDYTRRLLRQLSEVSTDVPYRSVLGRVGGRTAADFIRSTYRFGPLLLIGHSGGGAAAYQAARMLPDVSRRGDVRIVQIGSPKVPIDPSFRDRVGYFYAIDPDGRTADRISRLGSWGGWRRGRYALPRWDRMKFAPGLVEGLPVMGGHADYFRHEPDFTDADSICNLDKTIRIIRSWLKDWG
ncbi:alpha/beta hydrolase [Paenibacillus sp. 32O-W]|uniref:alpha/beta fold hydrolase n=1 Tax=Paenibacillus sp. 32O-W TaxID=1695218 RepID=UPI000720CB9E|nr:alpha/beta fold hydrolase [Paenibacillus sp. 32O-W]ALS26497.1 alpha/beta hydrolase [Paenibacillus sp. 32O-W]